MHKSPPGNLQRPTAYYTSVNKEVGEAFDEFRDSVMKSGPMDEKACELIIIAGLASVRNWETFKTHTRRLIKWGVPKEQIQQAIICCMGASLLFPQTSDALHLIDELFDEMQGAAE